MTVSHCSSEVSESVASHSTPAFRTTISRPPRRATAASTEARTAAGSSASARTKRAPVR